MEVVIEIDEETIADRIDVEAVAEHIDEAEVARHLDSWAVAQDINHGAVAEAINLDDLADHCAAQVMLSSDDVAEGITTSMHRRVALVDSIIARPEFLKAVAKLVATELADRMRRALY